jgi:hypothetical protein
MALKAEMFQEKITPCTGVFAQVASVSVWVNVSAFQERTAGEGRHLADFGSTG